MLPKISIITPSYNQGQFLEQTIISVLNQNYPNLEYIIIDGGSSDNSVEIIKKYQDKLAYWVSEKDEGQTDAINKGLKIATGEIINWLNSDDILLPGALMTIANAFNRYPEADFIYGDTAQIDEKGETIYIQKVIPFDKNIFVYGRILATQPSVFFRKRVIHLIGFPNKYFDFCMDLDFWGRAIKKNLKFMVCNKIISGNRFHSGTKTINLQETLVKEHKIIQDSFNIFFSKYPPKINEIFYEIFRFFYRFKWGLKKILLRRDIGFNRSKKAKRLLKKLSNSG